MELIAEGCKEVDAAMVLMRPKHGLVFKAC